MDGTERRDGAEGCAEVRSRQSSSDSPIPVAAINGSARRTVQIRS